MIPRPSRPLPLSSVLRYLLTPSFVLFNLLYDFSCFALVLFPWFRFYSISGHFLPEHKVRYNCKEMSIKVGPGGDLSRGSCWDDGSGKVRDICISYGEYGINSIQTVLELSRGSVLMEKHGGEGSNFRMISLASDESIILVSGSYDNSRTGGSALKSLRIHTTLHEYGPFATAESYGYHDQFSYEVPAGKFAGFHGRSSDQYLHAIGIYVHTEATVTLKEMITKGVSIDKMMESPGIATHGMDVSFHIDD